MDRDKSHQGDYPMLKQFYSLREQFFYDYSYRFKSPTNCTFDHAIARASQDLNAYKVFDQKSVQFAFNLLHPTPVDVEKTYFRVYETKLTQNLISYAFS